MRWRQPWTTSRCSSGRIGSHWPVHRCSLGFPAVEQRALADQIRRASKSICANLAEGFARQGLNPADFRRFIVMAMGSADEMRVWARYCLDLGYVDEATCKSGVRNITRSPRCCKACSSPWGIGSDF